jgi:excisionase family DNA binding protein
MTIDRQTPIHTLPELLRVPEAARYLSCSEGLVRELIRRQELPSVRLGRLLRIHRDSLATLVTANVKR